MPDCSAIDPLVTRFVDEDEALGAPERQAVQDHLHLCPPCRARVAVEQAVHGLLTTKRGALAAEAAPEQLHARCHSMLAASSTVADSHSTRWLPRRHRVAAPATWRARLAPLALAATLVIIVGGAFLYQATDSSPRLLAAELTADHIKCFAMNNVLGTHQSQPAVESSLASGFGWQVKLPEHPEEDRLELIGSRPCLYGEGRTAHVMYRRNGQNVSLFMLPPGGFKPRREQEVIDIFGHQAEIWSSGGRTFVLIASSKAADLGGYMRATLH